MRKWIAFAVLLSLAAPSVLRPEDRPAAQRSAPRYQCSMHPQIVSDKPGDCPVCGMRLQRVEETPEVARPQAGRKLLFYRHPMRPDVTSPKPAKDEMGMDYIPVYEDAAKAGAGIPGHAGFTLTPERQQLIGVRTSTVAPRALVLTIRAPGRVAHDPDLYNAATEYRQAQESRRAASAAALPEVRQRSEDLLRSAAIRLRQLGFSGPQAEELVRSTATLTSLIVPGHGGSAWFFVQVYQSDLGLVAPGQKVRVTSQSLPGRTYTGTVRAIDTMLDPETRSVKVRAQLHEAPPALAHEVYLDTEIEVPLGTLLAVPQDAVLDTGDHRIVFVRKGGREFEPREVVLGREAEGYFEVLEGLSEGEEVVTSANFLIDSESRFRSAVKAFSGAGGHEH